jgi:hypothetical protein
MCCSLSYISEPKTAPFYSLKFLTLKKVHLENIMTGQGQQIHRFDSLTSNINYRAIYVLQCQVAE